METTGSSKDVRPATKKSNGKGVKVDGVRFSKKAGVWEDLLLVAGYCVQSRGQATAHAVHDDITTKLNSKVQVGTVSDALEALRKADVLAMAQDSEGNRVFSMKRVQFNCNPELASVTQLIEVLKTDSTGQLILERVKKSGPEKKVMPEEQMMYLAEFTIIRPWLGSQIWEGNLELQYQYFAAGKYYTLHELDKNGEIKRDKGGNPVLKERFSDHTEVPCMFERTFDGKIIACHKASVRGFFENAIEAHSPTSNGQRLRKYHIHDNLLVEDVVVDLDPKRLSIARLPTMTSQGFGARGNSAPPKNYECIRAGTKLELTFGCPSKNFITPEEMKVWLAHVLRWSVRTMSPARGGQTGRAVLDKISCSPADRFHEFSFDRERWTEL